MNLIPDNVLKLIDSVPAMMDDTRAVTKEMGEKLDDIKVLLQHILDELRKS